MSEEKRIGYIVHESVTESETKVVGEVNNKPIAEATMQDADMENRNTRCYRAKDLARELVCERTKELIGQKAMKGELGHPTDPSLVRQQTIDPKCVCFRMDKLWMDGNLVKSIVTGTNNDYGRDFNQDLLEGEIICFSLRALGTIKQESGRNYVDNLRMITYDRVYYPSHKCAHITRLLESTGNGGVDPMAGQTVYVKNESGLLIPITNSTVMSYVKAESANLKNVFNTFDTLCESMSLTDNGKNVRMITKSGDMLVINLEAYIQNEIMDYCNRQK